MRVGREADIIAMADTGRPLKLNLRSSQVAPFPIFVLRSRDSAAPGQQADAAAASPCIRETLRGYHLNACRLRTTSISDVPGA